MECIEARALKSSFLSEMAMKSTQQAFFDDVWCVNGINGVSSEDFSVDVFLDFSDKDFKDGSLHNFEEYEEEEEEKDSLSMSSQDRADDDNSNSSGVSGSGDSGSLAAGELSVPVDDLKELEWLSEFVDDSASELSLLYPAGSFSEKTGHFVGNRSEPGTVRTLSPIFPAPVPAKARSKRSRPSGRVWPVGSMSSESSSLSSSSSSSSTASFVFPNRLYEMELFQTARQPVAKKQKKKPEAQTGGASQTQRRCSHCHVQKTPQWRTGPLGPKTLCNACGVRFKSGRLFPEYRPACSPTFSGDVHSNSHRKVLEMRRKKEVTGAETCLTPIVSSY